jgi:hypothetical protein
MANQFINAMSALWNSAGTVYTAIKMNVTNAASAAGSMLLELQVGAINKFSVDKDGNVIASGTVLGQSGIISNGPTLPNGNDTAALGGVGNAFSDLFLANGGVINWLSGDVTITHVANSLRFAGAEAASGGYSFDVMVAPAANDGAPLGSLTLSWSDLFLASGSVINWAASDLTLTHTANVLTLAGGNLIISTPGTAAGSVATINGTQTLTGKTITSPVLNLTASAAPVPTAEGQLQWNSTTNNFAVGDGVGTVFPGKPFTITMMVASGTWTKPAGCRQILVEAVGGGGAGGGITGSAAVGTACAGGGGGAGRYGWTPILDVVNVVNAAVVIGAGGLGRLALPGLEGGDTTITVAGTVYTWDGGFAGQHGTMNASQNQIILGGGAGGSTNLQTGGGAAIGGRGLSCGPDTTAISGEGGSTNLGQGAYHAISTGPGVVNGSPGNNFGSGGSGAAGCQTATSGAGGNGAPAVMRIWEFY